MTDTLFPIPIFFPFEPCLTPEQYLQAQRDGYEKALDTMTKFQRQLEKKNQDRVHEMTRQMAMSLAARKEN